MFVRRSIAAILLGIGVLLGACPAWAVSLGEINVSSALNQPLVAQIQVDGITSESASTLRAEMASPEAYQRAGLRREAFHDDISLTLSNVRGSTANLLLRSKRRIGEPFLSLLIEMKWAGGNVVREYTVLLDPVSSIAGTQRIPEPEPVAATRETYTPPPAQQASAYRGSGSHAGGHRYGPTKPQETLWSIALAHRPNTSISMDQMMLAIYKANPQAFDGNINRMYKGVTLVIPNVDGIRAVSPTRAKAQVHQQARASSKAPVSRKPVRAARPEPESEPSPSPTEPKVPKAVTEIARAPANSEPTASAPEPTADVKTAEKPAAEPVNPTTATAPSESAATTDTPKTDAPQTDMPPTLAPGSGPDVTVKGASPGPATAPKPAQTQAVDAAVDAEPATTREPLPVPSAGDLKTPSIWAEGTAGAPANTPAGQQPAVDTTQPAVDTTTPATAAQPANPMVDGAEATAANQASTTAPAATAPAPATPAPAPVAFEEETSILDSIPVLPLLALLVLGGATAFGVRAYKARRAQHDEASKALFDPSDLETPLPDPQGGVWKDQAGLTESTATTKEDELDLDSLFGPDPGATPRAVAFADKTAESTGEIQAQDIPVRDTDYIGEAELHIAYGLYDEASAVLERGVEEDPQRNDLWMKLLEVHSESSNAAEFASVLQRFKAQGRPTEADLRKIATWSQAPGMTASATSAVAATSTATVGGYTTVMTPAMAAPVAPDLEFSPTLEPAPVAPPPVAAPRTPIAEKEDTLEFDLSDFDLPADPPPPAKNPVEAVDAGGDLDFDLSGFDLPDEPAPKAATVSATPAVAAQPKSDDLLLDAGMADDLDFSLELPEVPSVPDVPEVPDTPPVAASSANLATSVSAPSLDDDLLLADDLDFSLDVPSTPTAAPTQTAMADDIDLNAFMDADPGSDALGQVDASFDQPASEDDEVAVKLDLARAYFDMGESEMAQALLEEVSKMGNAQQKNEARELMQRHR